MGLRKLPMIRVIYPSFNNVANSHDGLLGGGNVPRIKSFRHFQLNYMLSEFYRVSAIRRTNTSEADLVEWLFVSMARWLSSPIKSNAAHQNIHTMVREKNVLVPIVISQFVKSRKYCAVAMTFDLIQFLHSVCQFAHQAWGCLSKSKTSPTLRISNYEAGVLFLPKFVTNSRYFSMDECDQSTPLFPPLYDIPLTKYVVDDNPFLSDILFTNN